MKGLKVNFFLLILSFCSFFKVKAPGDGSEVAARAQFEQYGRQVALLRQKVVQTRQFNDSIMAMEQILAEELSKVDEIEDEISREESLERLDELGAQKAEIMNKVKPAMAEYSRLTIEINKLVRDCLVLNESVGKLEKALAQFIYQADSVSVSEESVAQPSVEAEISLIQKAFKDKMRAIDLEMSRFIDQIYRAGMRAPKGLTSGSEKDPTSATSFSSSSLEQQVIVGAGTSGQGKRMVSRRVVVDDNGQKFESSVSGIAEKKRPDGEWKFKVERANSLPGQEPKRSVESGSAQNLNDFDKKLSQSLEE